MIGWPRPRLVRAGLAAGLVVSMALLAGCSSAPVEDGGALSKSAPRPRPSTAENPGSPSPAPGLAPEQDGPPAPEDIPEGLASIEDAVPQNEPLSAYGNPDSYVVDGHKYFVVSRTTNFRERGKASWYGKKFQGKRTSSGDPYDMFKMTAAHKTLPIPCYARVTNLLNGRRVIVRVNDRGPFHSDRIVDVSYAAALKLGMLGGGETPVEVSVVVPGAAPITPAALLASDVAPDRSDLMLPSMPPPYLQAGVFNDANNAATLREQLYGAGLARVTLKSEVRSSGYVYRVIIGPFADQAEYADAQQRLVSLQLQAIPYTEKATLGASR